MQKISKHQNNTNAVHLLLGNDVLVVTEKEWVVNKFITIQSSLVNYPEQNLPNQFGQIICSKIDDNSQAVQLMYLQHHFTTNSTAIVFSIYFDADFLAQWDEQIILSEEAFIENSSGMQVAFSNECQSIIAELQNYPVDAVFAVKIRQFELSLLLLRKAIEHIGSVQDTYSVPACSFLNSTTERDKVLQAREILEEEFEHMLSIKELSKRVAINECYLKKGFKAMFGKTINEYQQHLRISKAKRLLQIDGYTVSEVANFLGYSSISHFSTAFKKATNMKPCELLK